MTTWILVMWAYGVTTIPGYATQTECLEAVKYFHLAPAYGKPFCIPAPAPREK